MHYAQLKLLRERMSLPLPDDFAPPSQVRHELPDNDDDIMDLIQDTPEKPIRLTQPNAPKAKV